MSDSSVVFEQERRRQWSSSASISIEETTPHDPEWEGLPARAEDEILRVRYLGLKEKVRKLEAEKHARERRRNKRRRMEEGYEVDKKRKWKQGVCFTTLAEVQRGEDGGVRPNPEGDGRMEGEWIDDGEESLFVDLRNEESI